jgi:hypothetical protein
MQILCHFVHIKGTWKSADWDILLDSWNPPSMDGEGGLCLFKGVEFKHDDLQVHSLSYWCEQCYVPQILEVKRIAGV